MTDSLLAIIRQYLKQHDLRTQSVSLTTLFEEYIEAKSHRTKKYLAEINKVQGLLKELEHRFVCDIASEELKGYLSQRKGAYRNAVMRYLRAMFNHGIKRGYLLDNPILKLDFVHRVRHEVQTIPYSIVARMLNHALENDLQLLPFLILGFFAGIRASTRRKRPIEWAGGGVTFRLKPGSLLVEYFRDRSLGGEFGAVFFGFQYDHHAIKFVHRFCLAR